jgi:hypothetical protein
MPKKLDLTGMKFGRWTAIREDGRAYQKVMWLCRCECGKEGRVSAGNLRNGLSKSCGCWNLEQVRSPKKHGLSQSPEFTVWQNMIERCTNPKNTAYENYGGRGISICERWRESFSNFYADMGPRPEGTTINRIDNDGNYEPSNCQWATDQEQQRNKRSNHRITAFGKTMLLTEWSAELGMSPALILYHMNKGKTLERISREQWPVRRLCGCGNYFPTKAASRRRFCSRKCKDRNVKVSIEL